MKRILTSLLSVLLVVGLFSSAASAAPIPLGYFSWNVTDPGVAGEFDIVNQSAGNSTPAGDPTWPVTDQIIFSNLSLLVHYTNATSHTFTMADFTDNGDNGWNGPSIDISTGVLPIDALLSGMFSPTTLTLNDGSVVPVLDTFSASIATNNAGLNDGDLQIIEATRVSDTNPVPEPATWMLMGTGVVGLIAARRRKVSKS